MIHVATVHWRSDRWIDIQRRHLDRFLGEEFRVYAFLNDIPRDHCDKFFYATTEPVQDHATKLNLLSDLIRFSADDPSDLLVVIDGDAFPVGPIAPLVEERLPDHRLIAVQQQENNGDVQPHPCFCVTTVGFWTGIGGDWHRGYSWTDARGEQVTDVGGNLLAALERHGIDWYPLRRVNRVNPHPLLFALYGDDRLGPLVYHHGPNADPPRSIRIGVDRNPDASKPLPPSRLGGPDTERRLRRRVACAASRARPPQRPPASRRCSCRRRPATRQRRLSE